MVTTSIRLTFEEYLNYDDGTDNRYELVRGELIKMNPPRWRHIIAAKKIERVLDAEIERLGLPWLAIREVGQQTEKDSSRLPDVCVVPIATIEANFDKSAVLVEASNLIVEVVSPSSVKQDYEEKPLEYANKGIPEVWIVDPDQGKVTVLKLSGGKYQTAVFQGQQAIASDIFPQLELTAAEIFEL